MIAMKRLMQTLVFAVVMLCQQEKAAMVLEPANNAQGVVLMGKGMGALQEQTDWYKDSRYVQILAQSAAEKGFRYQNVEWHKKNDPAGYFAGLHPHERIDGAKKFAIFLLDTAYEMKKPNDLPIVLIGHSLGGQLWRCACNLIDPANKDLGSKETLAEELRNFIKNLIKNGPNSFQCNKGELLLLRSWQGPEKIVEPSVKMYSAQELEHLLDFVKEEVTQRYLAEIEQTWREAFAEIQAYKEKLFGYLPIHKNLKIRLITVGTPNDIGVFAYNKNVIQGYFNYYSNGDFVAPLIGTRKVPLQETIANISVHFEVQTDVHVPAIDQTFEPPKAEIHPGHLDLLGNEEMAYWLLKFPEELKIPVNAILGHEIKISYSMDPTKPPKILDENEEKNKRNKWCLIL
ncbi:MAG: hypothetical protein WCT20_02570 [Candidatus Babeliales bacterium]